MRNILDAERTIKSKHELIEMTKCLTVTVPNFYLLREYFKTQTI